jgi:hypothetical protein
MDDAKPPKPSDPYEPGDDIFWDPGFLQWVSRNKNLEFTARWNDRSRKWEPSHPPESNRVIEPTYG